MRKRHRRMLGVGYAAIRGVLLVGLCFIILYPLLLKISSAFMTNADLYDMTVYWIPRSPTLENFKIAFLLMDYPTRFLLSSLLVITVSAAQLFSCTLIGYGFARFDFPGKNIWFGLVVFILLVPPQLIMLPLYLNFRYFTFFGLLADPGLNLIGSFWPFLLMTLTGSGLRNGLYIFIMRQFFRGMSSELEEAAYVDGAGSLRTFFVIMLPHAVPAMIVVFLFSFVWQWNDLFYTELFMPNAHLLPYSLSGLSFRYFITYVSAEQRAAQVFAEYASILNNTGMLLFIAPLLVLYAALQRYFIEGIERTGIVG